MLQAILEKLITKKKLIAWISAALIAVTAIATKLDSQEVKDAVCGAQSK